MSNYDTFELVKETNKLLSEIDALYESLNGEIYGNKEYSDLMELIDINLYLLESDKRIKYHGQMHYKMGKNGLIKVWVTF